MRERGDGHLYNPSVSKFGDRIWDALQTGIKLGYIYGPIHPDNMPWEDVKVAQLTLRLKPNGSARQIMDLSWPRDEHKIGEGWVLSPNKGMGNWVEFEKCTMTSDRFFRIALYRHGVKC